MRSRLVLVVAVAGLVALAACQPPKKGPPGSSLNPPPPDQPAPPGSPSLSSSDLEFVTGLSNPWDIAFAPNDVNTMFFTERHGPIKVKRGTAAPTLLGTPPGSAPSGEGGVMGIAVDPSFAMNNRIYVCYTTATDNRVVPFVVSDTFDSAVAGSPIVTGIPKNSSIHNGCRIRFGPDAMLWITTGDAANGTNPQNLNSSGGKVLRVTAAGGPAPGNPFGSLVFTFGHRNPQGIAFQPGTNVPYSVEHGPGINDEVNRLSAGGNGGWDPVPGYNQSVPMTDLAKFPQAMIPAWRSGDSFTLAPSGATFLSGSQWKSWNGALLVAFLKDSRARVMFLDGSGNVAFSTKVLEHGTRLRSVVQGPDGNLYVAADVGMGGGAIWKVVPT